jgi:hypothetical protein
MAQEKSLKYLISDLIKSPIVPKSVLNIFSRSALSGKLLFNETLHLSHDKYKLSG